MTEAQVEGSVIPEIVPVKGTAPEATLLEGATTEPKVPVAPEPTEEVHDDALLKASMDVVLRSQEIQDTNPIRSAPMLEAEPTSRGGLELLSDDLIDPAMVAQIFETMRRIEQWMKVREVALSSRIPQELSTQVIVVTLCRMSWRDPDINLICSRDMSMLCFGQKH
jgi:hypothetical protein